MEIFRKILDHAGEKPLSECPVAPLQTRAAENTPFPVSTIRLFKGHHAVQGSNKI